MATLEKERLNNVQDMAWANKYCVTMDKKMKKLEAELAKYQPQSGEIKTLPENPQPCIKEEPNKSPIKKEIDQSKIVKLKIRKSDT